MPIHAKSDRRHVWSIYLLITTVSRAVLPQSIATAEKIQAVERRLIGRPSQYVRAPAPFNGANNNIACTALPLPQDPH
jgi:hypothetical protein